MSNRRVASSPEAAEELHTQIKELNRKKTAAQQKIMGKKPLRSGRRFRHQGRGNGRSQMASQPDQQQQPAKEKFNPQNPQHKARAMKVLKEVEGIRNLAQRILFAEMKNKRKNNGNSITDS